MTTDWDEIALKYGTDKASSFHGYMADYERLLGQRPIRRLLELGVSHGSSLFMWRDLFPGALIVGVDNQPHCRLHQRIDIAVIIADMANPAQMAAVSKLHGPFDVIIDDGSHRAADTTAAFEELYPAMAKDGIYIVEDYQPDDPWVHEFADRWNGKVLPCTNGSLIAIDRFL
jgi:cephalosporin hydroxylase